MPLLKRRPVPLLPLPNIEGLDPSTPVYFLRPTGEIFLDYESYSARLSYLFSKIFQCEYSGKMNLDYFTAQKSERAGYQLVHERFPDRLKGRVLATVQFQVVGRLDALVDEVYSRYQERFFVGERVFVDVGGDKYYARIAKVFPPLAIRDIALHHTQEIRGDVSNISYDAYCHHLGVDLNVPREAIAAQDNADEYLYTVQLMDAENKFEGSYMEVKAKAIVRDRLAFSKSILKRFIRESVYREPMHESPWLVKPLLAQQYGLPLVMPADELMRNERLREGKWARRNAVGPAVDPKQRKKRRSKFEHENGNETSRTGTPDLQQLAIRPGPGAPAPTPGTPTPVARPTKYPIEDLDLDPMTIHDGRVLRRVNGDLPDLPSKPAPKRLLPVAPEYFNDFVMVWDMLNVFSKPLNLTCFTIDDFGHALQHNPAAGHSVLLTEAHYALLATIAQDVARVVNKTDENDRPFGYLEALAVEIEKYEANRGRVEAAEATAEAAETAEAPVEAKEAKAETAEASAEAEAEAEAKAEVTAEAETQVEATASVDASVPPQSNGVKTESSASPDSSIDSDNYVGQSSEEEEDELESDSDPKPTRGRRSGTGTETTPRGRKSGRTVPKREPTPEPTPPPVKRPRGRPRKVAPPKRAPPENDYDLSDPSVRDAEFSALIRLGLRYSRKWDKLRPKGTLREGWIKMLVGALCERGGPIALGVALHGFLKHLFCQIELTELVNWELRQRERERELQQWDERSRDEDDSDGEKSDTSVFVVRNEFAEPDVDLETDLDIERQYLDFPLGDKLRVLQYLVQLALGTKLVRNYIDNAESNLTDHRKQRADLNRDKKALNDQRILMDGRRRGGGGNSSNHSETTAANGSLGAGISEPTVSLGSATMGSGSVSQDPAAASGAPPSSADTPAEGTAPGAPHSEDEDTPQLNPDAMVPDEAIEDLLAKEASGAPRRRGGPGRGKKGPRDDSVDVFSRDDEETKPSTKIPNGLASASRSQIEDQMKQNSMREDVVEREFRRFQGVTRIRPLGRDRFYNRYWWLDGVGGMALVGANGGIMYYTGRLFVQGPSNDEYGLACEHEHGEEQLRQRILRETVVPEAILGQNEWAYYDDESEIEQLLAWLNAKGNRELALKNNVIKWKHYILGGARKRLAESEEKNELAYLSYQNKPMK